MRKHREETSDKRVGKVDHSKEKREGEAIAFVREASIHIIFRGPHIGGSGRNAIERYIREAKQPPLTNVNYLIEWPPKLLKGEVIQKKIQRQMLNGYIIPIVMLW